MEKTCRANHFQGASSRHQQGEATSLQVNTGICFKLKLTLEPFMYVLLRSDTLTSKKPQSN